MSRHSVKFSIKLDECLIEVYYANVYNATLLAHKPSFVDAVAAGTARSRVVLSVCALAANYDRKPLSDLLN